MNYKIIKIRDNPTLREHSAQWFHEKWNIPKQAYYDSMDQCSGDKGVPQWYIVCDGENIIGGAGVIENDFHNRPDLAPNVCAVYVEEHCRNRGIAGDLLNFICNDIRSFGIDTLYLITDHTSFYERYNWHFLCTAENDDGTLSRIYMHKI